MSQIVHLTDSHGVSVGNEVAVADALGIQYCSPLPRRCVFAATYVKPSAKRRDTLPEA